jgi:hypothetical protein
MSIIRKKVHAGVSIQYEARANIFTTGLGGRTEDFEAQTATPAYNVGQQSLVVRPPG